jgi:hypothetical protein
MDPDMTDEEAEYWDELLTRTTPKLSGKSGGFFTDRARMRIESEKPPQTVPVDKLTAGWLHAMTETTHKTPTELIGELVREKVFAASE